MRQKAVFLDRDGVINDDTGHYYIYRPEDFKLNEGIIEGLKQLKDHGFLLVVVTNQGGVAKGEYSESDLQNVHDKLQSILLHEGVSLEGIYYCPHHDSVGPCSCRKPKPGMILQAMNELDIDPNLSFLIGDSDRDIQAGKQAGLKQSFLISTNSNIGPVVQQIIHHQTQQ
jgi:D-glycero-D-manno-heptose 1,7-bisphosphate phosphatase